MNRVRFPLHRSHLGRSVLLAGLMLLGLLGPAQAASTRVNLFGPMKTYTAAEGTVTFPFGYYNIDASSGRKMYDDPVIAGYYAAIRRTSQAAGYSRACLSRQIYQLRGTSVADLTAQELTWVKALMGRPTSYTLLNTQKYNTFRAGNETVTGTAYVMQPPGMNMVQIFAFFVYPGAKVTWVLECGSGR